ncbi:MAG: MOSC domain-containing protein [Phycisphaerales bacterium]|nr:MOSC domain-containing protein [Phycisphaerales bacterium]
MASVHRISVSDGGVPKGAVERAAVGAEGLEGDRQNDRKHHGGPERAVCLFALEVIERLRGEGHPIGPGTTGENLTIEGLDWPRVVPGARLVFDGGVELEISSFTTPCATIRDSFTGLAFGRIKQADHPGESRVYARVIRGGALARGEGVRLVAAGE